MKIAVITITCNRLKLTKKYLSELKDKNNTKFEHIIIDNGSTDGTIDWLFENNYTVIRLSKNIGIFKAFKIGIKYVKENIQPDYIMKFDDDCEMTKFGILDDIIDWFNSGCKSFVVAPLDLDILDTHMPQNIRTFKDRGYACRLVKHVGGIFVIAPSDAFYRIYDAPESLVHEDSLRGKFWWSCGYPILYLEDLKIRHRGLFKSVDNYKLLDNVIERPK